MARVYGRHGRLGRRGMSTAASSAAEARLMAAAASRTAVSKRPWYSVEAIDERDYCRHLYRFHMKDATPNAPGKAERAQKLEDLCGHFKSLWSSWWTETDAEKQWMEYNERFQRCQTKGEGCSYTLDLIVKSLSKSRSVEQSLPPPPPPRPSLLGRLFVMYSTPPRPLGRLLIEQVVLFCV